MLLSKEDMFCYEQTIGTAIGNTDSTDTLDWSAHGNDVGRFLSVFAMVAASAASSGSPTLTISWQTSADNSTFTPLKTWGPFALADVVKGAYLIDGEPLPFGLKQYNKLVFAGADAAFSTAPKITAGVVRNDVPIER